ncbi:MAG: pyridoxamine 5'-phosphate oxidase family protein [Bacteroidota bacterium]
MFLSPEIKECIDKAVLCWLATSSKENIPNVSPKEMFTYYQDEFIIVANIAIDKVRLIIAPRYLLYPETTEAQQVAAAKKQYNLI